MSFRKSFKGMVLAVLFLGGGIAQAQPTEVKVSRAIDGMYALLQATSAGHPTYYMKAEKITNEKGATIGQTVRDLSYESHGYGYLGFTNSAFKNLMLEVDGDAITKGSHTQVNCKADAVYFTWNGDKLSEVNLPYDGYLLSYDDKDRIIALTDNSWSNTSKNNYVRRIVHLSYDEQGRVLTSERIKENGTGKSAAEVKTKLSFTESRKVIEYLENGLVTVTFTEFASKNKAKDPEVVNRTRVFQYELGQEKSVYTTYANGKISDKKEIQVIGPGKIQITEDASYGNHKVLTCTLDERGWLTHILEEGTKRDKTKELKVERIYSYKRNQDASGDTPCDYKLVALVRNYDSEGNVVREFQDGKVRDKLPNGDWSEWSYR